MGLCKALTVSALSLGEAAAVKEGNQLEFTGSRRAKSGFDRECAEMLFAVARESP
jgi:hypothetical protein